VWIRQQQRWHTLLALLRMDVINYSICHPEKPVRLEDLVPDSPKAQASAAPRRMTAKRRQAVADKIRMFFEVKRADEA
jgi:hypothetical protein